MYYLYIKMSTVQSLVTSFNGSIKFFSRVYVSKNKKTSKSTQAELNNRRLNMIIDHEPMCIIREAGPYLLKYADIIHRGDWEKLINTDFSEDVKSHSSNGSSDISSEISFIKKVFADCSQQERAMLGEKLQSLLSDYCEYALIVKNS